MRSLLNALAPIIGAEASRGDKAVSPGWAVDVKPEQFTEWRKQGNELVLKELEDLFQDTCAEEYRVLIHKVPPSNTCARVLVLIFLDSVLPCAELTRMTRASSADHCSTC